MWEELNSLESSYHCSRFTKGHGGDNERGSHDGNNDSLPLSKAGLSAWYCVWIVRLLLQWIDWRHGGDNTMGWSWWCQQLASQLCQSFMRGFLLTKSDGCQDELFLLAAMFMIGYCILDLCNDLFCEPDVMLRACVQKTTFFIFSFAFLVSTTGWHLE